MFHKVTALLGFAGIYLSQADAVLGAWPKVQAAAAVVSSLLLFVVKTERVIAAKVPTLFPPSR